MVIEKQTIDEEYYITELKKYSDNYPLGTYHGSGFINTPILEKLSVDLVDKEHLCTFKAWATRMNTILIRTKVFSSDERLAVIEKYWYDGYKLHTPNKFWNFIYRTRSIHVVLEFLIPLISLIYSMAVFDEEFRYTHEGLMNTYCALLFVLNFIMIIMSIEYLGTFRLKFPFILCAITNVSLAALFVVAFHFPFVCLWRMLWISIPFLIIQIFDWIRSKENEYEDFCHMRSGAKADFVTFHYS